MSIKHPIYHGKVSASGFFYPFMNSANREVMDTDFAHYLLSYWDQGIQLYKVSEGWVLTFNRTLDIDSDRCRGYPLVKQKIGLSSAPLEDTEMAELAMNEHSIAVALGQKVSVFETSPTHHIELSEWVDINTYQLVDIEHLGRISPEKPTVKVAEVAKESEGKAIFGEESYGSSKEAAETLKELKDKVSKHSQKPSSVLDGVGEAARDAVALPKGIMGGIASGIRNFFTTEEGYAQGTETAYSQHSQATPSSGGFKQWFSNWVMSSRLGRTLGRRQARYLQNMQKMFDQNNLQDALKNAIPLSDVNDLFKQAEGKAAMGKPSARPDLSITTGYQSGVSGINVGEEYEEMLRQTYRNAFHKLDREKKYKDAAFVLAELLRETEEAVNYLEKHKQFQLAAELAEGRLLRPEIAVRQWLLAGEFDRAVLIARQTGCYQQAVELVEQKDTKKGKELRLAWAITLAKAGDYVKACDVISSLNDQRKLAEQFLDIAMQAGGEAAIRLIPRKLLLHPESYETLIDQIQFIVNDESKGSSQRRAVFIDSLQALKTTTTPELKVVARLLARSYLLDCANHREKWIKSRLQSLTKIGGDLALNFDMRNLSFMHHDASNLRHHKGVQELQAELQGTGEIADIKMLRNQRYLIAHGEAGVTLRKADGSVIRRFNVPAEQLVISDLQNRAIAVIQRGKAMRISKLDFDTGKVEALGDGYFSYITRSYDGDTWLVADKDRVYALDMLSTDLKAVWQVKDLPGSVVYIQRIKKAFVIIMDNVREFEYWRYELPSLTLRERTPISRSILEKFTLFDVSKTGNIGYIQIQDEVELSAIKVGIKTPYSNKNNQVELPISGFTPTSIRYDEDWLIVHFIENTEEKQPDILISLVDARTRNDTWDLSMKLTLRISATSKVSASIEEEQLLVNSEEGGVMAIDLNDSLVSHRLSL